MIWFLRKKEFAFPRWLLDIVIIFFIVSTLIAAAVAVFEFTYSGRIYPGVAVAGIELGGANRSEAVRLINEKVDRFNQHGIIFKSDEKKAALLPLVASVEADLAYQIVNFDAEKTAKLALDYGRHDNFFLDFGRKFLALRRSFSVAAAFTMNADEVRKFLVNNFASDAMPAKNAAITYTALSHKPFYRFAVEEEKLGHSIDYDRAIAQFRSQLERIDESPITLVVAPDYPEIYKQDCLNIETKAFHLLDTAPFIVSVGEKEWKIERADLVGWLTLKSATDDGADKVRVGLDYQAITGFLKDKIAPTVNRPPVDARFEIKDGRVLEFQASRDGLELVEAASAAQIDYEITGASISKATSTRIELVTKQSKSQIHMETINDLGIKEIIGHGESSFAGSPKNRRHNIRVGADSVNGLLIKPDEEFSLIKALGAIDATTGYLPELVIKDNKTIPEYGGGLCQIGTTVFRAALGTGLPITMRRNHSYRVSYYEPAGTDATIYDPWPDLRFLNDTGKHILIQSRIEGDNLYFDFWGTPDGRIATRTAPVISNIVRPGPTKIIETLDLKPGEKKCTEHAHNGADAYFDYSVTYPGGEVKEKRFSSHYVPWREVCLLGVEKLSSDKTDTASSTGAISND